MTLLDIIVGYFIPDLFGWLFFGLVVIIETIILKRLLGNDKVSQQGILILVIVANLVTTLMGFLIGELTSVDYKYHIGHVINNVPIDYYRGDYSFGRGIFIFTASFITTIIFETTVFYFGLKKYGFKMKDVFVKSLKINLASYLIGLIIIAIYAILLVNN